MFKLFYFWFLRFVEDTVWSYDPAAAQEPPTSDTHAVAQRIDATQDAAPEEYG